MKYLFILITFVFSVIALGQSFAPVPGVIGSKAIYKDSSIIKSWASGVVLNRGYKDVANKSNGKVGFGIESNALYKAEGDGATVVSLGDSGVAILTFDFAIENGDGPDFAVFENGFTDNYIELAFVEVSSDGVKFVRFPSYSEASQTVQIGPFEYSDCRYYNNLAGKYRQGYGTPFDLEDLKDSSGIDLNYITHVKLIDVIGTIDENFALKDEVGRKINDTYPTPFESGGFDLDAVAVINQGPLMVKENELDFIKVYPNPTIGILYIQLNEPFSLKISNIRGGVLYQETRFVEDRIDLSNYSDGLYFIEIETEKGVRVLKVKKGY